MNEHHQVNVIRVSEIKVHPNADKLEIIPIDGYQVVVGKGQFKVGDLAYYVPPDSVVPDRPEYSFIWGGAEFPNGVPASKRRITARRLRGEYSEGLLMPLEEPFPDIARINGENCPIKEGWDIADALHITHYNAPEPGSAGEPKRRRVFPRSWRGFLWLIRDEYQEFARHARGALYAEDSEGNPGVPDYSIQALKKFPNTLVEGENVFVTEKIHGSNARYSFRKNNFGFGGKMYVGSHYTWRTGSSCNFRRALLDNLWIEKWCRNHPGYTLYGELVPTQNDYKYGCEGRQQAFFVFDVLTPDGEWLPLTDHLFTQCVDIVPVLYLGPYKAEHIKTLADGKSMVPLADHIREGVVVQSIDREHRVKLKIVSNAFLEKEGRK